MKKIVTILCSLLLFLGIGSSAFARPAGGYHHGYHKGGGYHQKGYHYKRWHHGTPRGWHKGNKTGWRGKGMPPGQFRRVR